MLPIVINIILGIHVIVSILIVFFTLMQRPKNEGLGAAFGGGMTDNLFGAQTTNVLQTITKWLGATFFALTLLLSFLYARQSKVGGALRQKLTAPTQNAPAAQPAQSPASEKTGAESAPVEKPVDSAAEKPAAEKPAAEKPAAEKPAAEKPAAEKPAAEKPAAEKPAAEKPAAEKPAAPAAPAAPAVDANPGAPAAPVQQ
jgi:preprotein translocase subunit SecG